MRNKSDKRRKLYYWTHSKWRNYQKKRVMKPSQPSHGSISKILSHSTWNAINTIQFIIYKPSISVRFTYRITESEMTFCFRRKIWNLIEITLLFFLEDFYAFFLSFFFIHFLFVFNQNMWTETKFVLHSIVFSVTNRNNRNIIIFSTIIHKAEEKCLRCGSQTTFSLVVELLLIMYQANVIFFLLLFFCVWWLLDDCISRAHIFVYMFLKYDYAKQMLLLIN